MKKEFHFEDSHYQFTYIDHTRITVRAVLLDEHNRVALNHCVCDDLFGHRDCYELPGGGKKKSESFKDGVKREIEEETGYLSEVISFICVVDDYYNLIHRHNRNYYYLLKRKKFVGTKREADETMIQDVMFVDIDKAIELMEHSIDDGVGPLVAQREVPVLKLIKEKKSEYFANKR